MGPPVLEAERIGEALRALRAERGVSQSELARRTGVAQPAISRIEAGHEIPSFERVARLAAGLGLRPVLEFVEAGDGGRASELPPLAIAGDKAGSTVRTGAWGDLRERLRGG